MIKLDVQEYCHGCANFTADVKEPEKYYAGFDIIEMTDTLVRCEHRKLCENLVRYLRKQVDLDEKSENQQKNGNTIIAISQSQIGLMK